MLLHPPFIFDVQALSKPSIPLHKIEVKSFYAYATNAEIGEMQHGNVMNYKTN